MSGYLGKRVGIHQFTTIPLCILSCYSQSSLSASMGYLSIEPRSQVHHGHVRNGNAYLSSDIRPGRLCTFEFCILSRQGKAVHTAREAWRSAKEFEKTEQQIRAQYMSSTMMGKPPVSMMLLPLLLDHPSPRVLQPYGRSSTLSKIINNKCWLCWPLPKQALTTVNCAA